MQKLLLAIVGLGIVVVGLMSLLSKPKTIIYEPALGGGISEPFQYASTTAAGRALVKTTFNAGARCELGSIVVNTTGAGVFQVWDATSTTDVASTSMLKLKSSVVEGTYEYNVACKRGLVIDAATGFNGNYTTTYK